jgi:hypothetical protein
LSSKLDLGMAAMNASREHKMFRLIRRTVKRTSQASVPPHLPSGPGRGPLEGIELVLVAGVIVLLAALLAAPRATPPELLPLPLPDRRVLFRAANEERELATSARKHTLSFDVRAVGELFRRFGASTEPGQGVSQRILADLRTAARKAVSFSNGRPLRELRAVQTELFVAATREWESSRRVPRELRELGGDFPELATENGWFRGGRLVLDEAERAMLFRQRWGELTGLGKRPGFATTLDEQRANFSFLLRHPSGRDALARRERQFAYVNALEKLDRNYPAHFARGVLLYRSRAFEAAAAAFQTQLEQPSNPRYRLRARNHLLASLAESPSEE